MVSDAKLQAEGSESFWRPGARHCQSTQVDTGDKMYLSHFAIICIPFSCGISCKVPEPI